MALERNIGRNANISNTATTTTPEVNPTTAVVVFTASIDKIKMVVINYNPYGVWLREKAASVDNNKEGYFLPRYSMAVDIVDNKYSGEVSAISEKGTFDIQAVVL